MRILTAILILNIAVIAPLISSQAGTASSLRFQDSSVSFATNATHSSAKKASVVIDGKVLFTVGSIEGFSAQKRARDANLKIDRALSTLDSQQPISIQIRQKEDLTTLQLNNRHLLTVTEADFMPGVTPGEQAEVWQNSLQTAIDRAQKERTAHYQRRSKLTVLGLVAIAIIITLLMRRFRRQLNRKIRLGESSGWISHQPVKTVLQPLLSGVPLVSWAMVFFYLTELFPTIRQWRYQVLSFFGKVLSDPIFNVGESNYSVLDVLKLLVLYEIHSWLLQMNRLIPFTNGICV